MSPISQLYDFMKAEKKSIQENYSNTIAFVVYMQGCKRKREEFFRGLTLEDFKELSEKLFLEDIWLVSWVLNNTLKFGIRNEYVTRMFEFMDDEYAKHEDYDDASFLIDDEEFVYGYLIRAARDQGILQP